MELEAVSSYLRGQNFETIEAADGLTGLREFFNVHPDFVVADLSVREMPVWNVITRIRELSDAPIIDSTLTPWILRGFSLVMLKLSPCTPVENPPPEPPRPVRLVRDKAEDEWETCAV